MFIQATFTLNIFLLLINANIKALFIIFYNKTHECLFRPIRFFFTFENFLILLNVIFVRFIYFK